MKSPGVIYRRYRQLKRKLLYEKMQEARRLSGRNCIYGKPLDIIDKGKVFHVNVCLYNKNVNTGLEVCNNTEECNAFICKFSKKDIEESFNKDAQ